MIIDNIGTTGNHPKIYVTGDTHGDIDWGKISVDKFPEQKHLTKEDYLLITGDFGAVWDEGKTDSFIQKIYNNRNFTTLFIDGNHENHDALDRYPVEIWNGGKVHKISDSIIHLMRGQVYEIGGKTFFTMGGAESIDKYFRFPGRSWWERELPSMEEYAEAFHNLEKCNYKVDYIITHCGPECFLNYDKCRNALTDVFDAFLLKGELSYTMWFCGHYHRDAYYDEAKLALMYNDIYRIM